MYVNAVSNNLKIIIIFLPYRVMPSLRPIINELQFLRAVARFFVTGGGGGTGRIVEGMGLGGGGGFWVCGGGGGGGTITIVEGMSLVGSVGVFSLRKF